MSFVSIDFIPSLFCSNVHALVCERLDTRNGFPKNKRVYILDADPGQLRSTQKKAKNVLTYVPS